MKKTKLNCDINLDGDAICVTKPLRISRRSIKINARFLSGLLQQVKQRNQMNQWALASLSRRALSKKIMTNRVSSYNKDSSSMAMEPRHVFACIDRRLPCHATDWPIWTIKLWLLMSKGKDEEMIPRVERSVAIGSHGIKSLTLHDSATEVWMPCLQFYSCHIDRTSVRRREREIERDWGLWLELSSIYSMYFTNSLCSNTKNHIQKLKLFPAIWYYLCKEQTELQVSPKAN